MLFCTSVAQGSSINTSIATGRSHGTRREANLFTTPRRRWASGKVSGRKYVSILAVLKIWDCSKFSFWSLLVVRRTHTLPSLSIHGTVRHPM